MSHHRDVLPRRAGVAATTPETLKNITNKVHHVMKKKDTGSESLAKEIPKGFVHAAFCDIHGLSPVLSPAGLAAGRKIEVGKRRREF